MLSTSRKLSSHSEELSFGIIECSGKNTEKKRREGIKLKLKKIGFDASELDKRSMIRMNRERFRLIEDEQRKDSHVWLPDEDPELPKFRKLPYMNSFADKLKLNKKVLNAMAHYEIVEPTVIQSVAIPYITDTNCDMIIQAQTGSGKTNCFLLPIIDYIIQAKTNLREYSLNTTSPYAIIVAPTKELVVQLACDATRLTRDLNWEAKVSYSIGGQDPKAASKMFGMGCDILVLTAGRLYDYFGQSERNMSRLNTEKLKFVVMDEADMLLKPSNGNQSPSLLKQSNEILYDFIVDRLTNIEKRDFRCLLFSATIDFDNFRYYVVPKNLIRIKVGGIHANFTVKQSFVEIEQEYEKQKLLMDIIECIAQHYQNDHPRVDESEEQENIGQKIGKTIIFVNHKRDSDRFAHGLIAKGFSARSINSDRSTAQRLEAFKDLMDGTLDILVSTDIIGRGVNIPRVDYIINYDLPYAFKSNGYSNEHEYLHRIGRCGRIGNLGSSITMFNPKKDRHWSKYLIDGCKAAQQEVPALLRDSYNWQQRSPVNFDYQRQDDYYASSQKPYYSNGKGVYVSPTSNYYG